MRRSSATPPNSSVNVLWKLKMQRVWGRCLPASGRRGCTSHIPNTRAISTIGQNHVNDKGGGRETTTTVSPSDVFSRGQRGSFFQTRPQLYNTFVEDVFLTQYLRRVLPLDVCEEVFRDLERFGDRVSKEIELLGRQAELEPPFIRKYDGWGEKVDELVTSPAWRTLHSIAAEEGLVAIAYERKHSQWSRLHQIAKTILWGPSSGLYSCPIAMTDGAASLIESSRLTEEMPTLRNAFDRLTTRDSDQFWTSGQWMTERRGGSDVGQSTDTVAVRQDDGSFKLYGYKWFTSATDANIAFTLARIQDSEGMVEQGSRGLSLFYLETRLAGSGHHNNLELIRLKDKLGTRQLPTAELLLDGTTANLVGEEGRGVAHISPMLTITRLHNSVISSSYMRRIMQLTRDYATHRTAFGKFLVEHPLHMRTLAQMEVETRGSTLLTLETARLLGLEEAGLATSSDSHLLRLLSSINKLYTAKQAVAVISEGLESFGGAGYLEDTGLPVLLRDAQVGTIWEGTTNVLSLDLLRVLQKVGHEILGVVTDTIKSRLSVLPLTSSGLSEEKDVILLKMNEVVTFVLRAMEEEPRCLEIAARDLALSLAHVYISVLLMEQACSPGSSMTDRVVAQRWCSRTLPLQQISIYTQSQSSADTMMVMDGHKLSHTLTH